MDTRPTIHVREAAHGRYHITISGPNRAYGVQRLRDHLPQHGARCYRKSDDRWSTDQGAMLRQWLAYDRTVKLDWPQAEERSA